MDFTMGSRPVEAPAGLEPATLAKQLLTRSRHLSYGAVCRVARGVDKRRGLGDETLSSGIYLPRFSPQINISFVKIRPLFPRITSRY